MKCPKCGREMVERYVRTTNLVCCDEKTRQAFADVQAADEEGREIHVEGGLTYIIAPRIADGTPQFADCFFCEHCILVVVPAVPGLGRS